MKYEAVEDGSGDKCELLGPFALFVQGVMGVIVVGTLVWKRYHERPVRRPWKVWAFDVSKQVIGASFVHVVNVFISVISRVRMQMGVLVVVVDVVPMRKIVDNPCDYYFLNLLFDTTVGIPVLYGCLIGVTKVTRMVFHAEGVESGEYGDPPRTKYYLKQLAIYLIASAATKAAIYETMVTFPVLVHIAMWMLSRLDKYPTVQEGFVLLVFPLVMNVVQYYVVDTLIKGRNSCSSIALN